MSETASSPAERLSGLLGAGRLTNDAAARAAAQVDGLQPMAVLRPDSPAEVLDVVRFALAQRLAIVPMAGRTKLGIGMPPRQYDIALDLSAMNRVIAYDPQDLTLCMEPGARFADLERQLAECGQFLPLAPAFAERATLGGMVASGADTPFRYGHGTSRDCVLGMEFVTGEGIASKSGGRVVKNVTGYDLHKLLIGSLGTLAIITRINFRTFPVPAARGMSVASFHTPEAALGFCAAIASSTLQPRLVEVADPGTARLFATRIGASAPPDYWSVFVEAAGHPIVVARHATDLGKLAREAQAAEFAVLDESRGEALVSCISEFPAIIAECSPGAALFRIAVLPSAMVSVLENVRIVAERHALEASALMRAAGVVYAALEPVGADPGTLAKLVVACRELMATLSGDGVRATIQHCPPEVKAAMSIWPQPGPEQTLAERIKKVFDPHGILSPGRFQGGL